jgi:hypothetical protein
VIARPSTLAHALGHHHRGGRRGPSVLVVCSRRSSCRCQARSCSSVRKLPPGPVDKFIVGLLAGVAELEAGLISARTKAALQAAKARA